MTDTIFKFPELNSTPIEGHLDGWKSIEGKPAAQMQTWIQHTSKDESVISGVWKSTTGFYHATYSAYEFVHLIEGSCIITPDGGESQTFNAGDAFVVEADFVGVWEVTAPIKKHFAIKLK